MPREATRLGETIGSVVRFYRHSFLHRHRADMLLDRFRALFYIPYYYQTISAGHPRTAAGRFARPIKFTPPEHDPEKWEPVFGKDHAQTRA